MNSALAAFVEGKSKSGDWWHRDTRDAAAKQVAAMPLREPRAQEVNERLPLLSHTPNTRREDFNQSGYLDTGHQQAINDVNGESSTEPPPIPPMATGDDSPSGLEGGLRLKPKAREAFAGSTDTISPVPWQAKDDRHGGDLASMIRATATRAAGLVSKRKIRYNLKVWAQTSY
jgi:hypothetical protein